MNTYRVKLYYLYKGNKTYNTEMIYAHNEIEAWNKASEIAYQNGYIDYEVEFCCIM